MFNTIESPAKKLAKCSEVDVMTKVLSSFFLKKQRNTPQTPTSALVLNGREAFSKWIVVFYILF